MMRFILAVVFLFSSCSSGKFNKSNPINQKAITFETIVQDFYGGMSNSKFVVINDLKSLDEIYILINKNRYSKLEVPEVNFEKEMIIALFLGERTSGGFSISVERILNNNNNVMVFYKIVTPKQDDMLASVMTQPFCIIKMPNTSKEIIFKEINY